MAKQEFCLADLGINKYDGVLAAYLPKLNSVMTEHYNGDYTLYSQDGVAYDILPTGKWWKVRQAARDCGLNIVEPIWQGPAHEFSVDRLPDVPKLSHDFQPAKLYIRAYSKGPWICLESLEEAKEANCLEGDEHGSKQLENEQVCADDDEILPSSGDNVLGQPQ